MKEIAQVMGVSEPRISQIHSRAIQKLREHMGAYMNSGCPAKTRHLLIGGEPPQLVGQMGHRRVDLLGPLADVPGQPVLEDRELQETLAAGISSLQENEQIVLSLYYEKNLHWPRRSRT